MPIVVADPSRHRKCFYYVVDTLLLSGHPAGSCWGPEPGVGSVQVFLLQQFLELRRRSQDREILVPIEAFAIIDKGLEITDRAVKI